MTASGWHRIDPTTPAARARRAKYDSPEHRAARRTIAALVAQGLAHCWRCGTRLVAGRWVVGHDDVRVDLIRGGECQPCNHRAAASKGARIANAKRRGTPASAAQAFRRPVR